MRHILIPCLDLFQKMWTQSDHGQDQHKGRKLWTRLETVVPGIWKDSLVLVAAVPAQSEWRLTCDICVRGLLGRKGWFVSAAQGFGTGNVCTCLYTWLVYLDVFNVCVFHVWMWTCPMSNQDIFTWLEPKIFQHLSATHLSVCRLLEEYSDRLKMRTI